GAAAVGGDGRREGHGVAEEAGLRGERVLQDDVEGGGGRLHLEGADVHRVVDDAAEGAAALVRGVRALQVRRQGGVVAGVDGGAGGVVGDQGARRARAAVVLQRRVEDGAGDAADDVRALGVDGARNLGGDVQVREADRVAHNQRVEDRRVRAEPDRGARDAE